MSWLDPHGGDQLTLHDCLDRVTVVATVGLAVRWARAALPVWHRERPDDRRAVDAICVAVDWLHTPTTQVPAETVRSFHRLDDTERDTISGPAQSAFNAASSALHAAYQGSHPLRRTEQGPFETMMAAAEAAASGAPVHIWFDTLTKVFPGEPAAVIEVASTLAGDGWEGDTFELRHAARLVVGHTPVPATLRRGELAY